jgi:hypothetical protein
VPAVNPKHLSIARESVDNHGDGRCPQVDLVRRGRAVPVARSLANRKFSPFGISSMCSGVGRPSGLSSAISIAWCLRGSITWLRGVGRGENPQAGDHHQIASRWVRAWWRCRGLRLGRASAARSDGNVLITSSSLASAIFATFLHRTKHTIMRSERAYLCRRTHRFNVMCAEQGACVRRRSWAGYTINMFEFEFRQERQTRVPQ